MGKYKALSPIERFKKIPAVLRDIENWYKEKPTEQRWKYYSLSNFLIYTGARITEALLTRWKDIDLENKQCTLHQLKKKKEAYKILPLHHKLYEIFKSKINEIDDKNKKIWDITRQAVHSFFYRRYKINPHMFRHYFGTQLVKNAGMETARRALGHTNYEILKIYLHLDLEDIREAIEQLKIF